MVNTWKFTQESMPRPTVPASLVAEGGYLGALSAVGDQIYRLGNDGIWRFVRPEARLYFSPPGILNPDGVPYNLEVGKHFGATVDDGTGNYIPHWQQTLNVGDNSGVRAAKVASVDAPDKANDLPWLKLQVTLHYGKGPENAGTGVFGGTQYIQRINTHGGLAPRDIPNGATPGVDWRVPYTATYCFWGADVRVRGGIL